MTTKQKLMLAETERGRIVLHLAALFRDGRFGWHLTGVLRQLRELHVVKQRAM
jgi:hypothetical protein